MPSAIHRAIPLIIVLIAVVLVAPLSARAQTSALAQSQIQSTITDKPEAPIAFVNVEMYRDAPSDVEFTYATRLTQKYNFAKILSAALGCELQDKHVSPNDDGTSELDAQCDLPTRRTLLTHAAEIDPGPFEELQRGESDYDIGIIIRMPRDDVARCDPTPSETPHISDRALCIYILKNDAQVRQRLQFSFGYSRAHATRIFSLLTILLLAPIALTFWYRKRALNVPEEVRPALSFAHRRFLTWTSTLGALAWWTAIDLLHANDYVAFAVPPTKWTDSFATDVLPWILLWIPALAVYFLCLVLSSPLQTLRGTNHTQREIYGRSFWSIARFALPFSFLALALATMGKSPQIGFLFVAISFLSGGLARRRFARAYGMELHALTSGELRDRAFAMAQAAGTKLNQLYVLPMERMRVANAFAHVAHNIFLTDYLVKNLSRREVDAILGHEIAHLQKKHIGRRMTMTIAVMFGFGFGAAYSESWFPRAFPLGPIFLALLLLLLYFTSRRNEFAADAGAVKLTGDAEAMITGLAKLSLLNTMPLHWGKVDEKLLTHPSTLRRIKKLAREGGIPEERIPELLSQAKLPPADVYLIPATALPAGKIFSTRYKNRITKQYLWASALTGALIPSLIVYASQWGRTGSPLMWTTYVTGFVLTIAAETLIAKSFARRGLPKLEYPLREKAKSEGAVLGDRNGLYVSLAPDSAPRIYEGNWAWDLGFLSVTPNELIYWGEEARFVLRREEIISLSVGLGSVSWFENSTVYVTWRDVSGREMKFHLRPLQAYEASVLAQELQNWHRGIPMQSGSILMAIQPVAQMTGAPKFGQVTSVSPKSLVRAQYLMRDLVFNMFVSLGMVFALGLYLPPLDMLSEPSGSAYLNPAAGAVYVLAVVLLTRIFLLIPFWRFRETKLTEINLAADTATENQS